MRSVALVVVALTLCAPFGAGCGLVLDTKPGDDVTDDASTDGDGGTPDLGCFSNLECDDGDPCNGEERCDAGECKPGEALSCDDGVSCTVDSCETGFGCLHTATDSLCDSTQMCFEDIGCSADRPCDDPSDCGHSDACVGAFECVENKCQRGDPIVCEGSGCLVAQCRRGQCIQFPDSDLCNEGTAFSCAFSECLPSGDCGQPIGLDFLCDDGIACTDDSCSVIEGSGVCDNVPSRTFCDDEVDCTITACAPDDPTADFDGCAIRLNHDVCGSDLAVCTAGACTPAGCTAVFVEDFACEGDPCDVNAGVCSGPQGESLCLALSNPCMRTAWNGEFCEVTDGCPDPVDVCAIPICDISSGTPRCDVVPDQSPDCLPPLAQQPG